LWPLRDKGGRAAGSKKNRRTIGICASGPSATHADAQALTKVCDETIAVNDSYRLANFDHLYATDSRWWKHHIADVMRDFEGTCWTQSIDWDVDPAQWGIKCLTGNTDGKGLSRDKTKVHTGKNSGYAALNLAYHLGAERIILIGYDMQKGACRHWFGSHPEPMEVESCYPDFIRKFETIIPADYGIEIWNCTRSTALACFPIYDFDEVTDRLR